MPQAVLLGAFVSVALTGWVIYVAEARQWAGDVTPGVQRCHDYWVTRLGGVAVLASLELWLLLGPLPLPPGTALLWLACLAPAFAAGFAEDITGAMSARARLAITLAGAAIAWLVLDVRVERLGVGWIDAHLAALPLLSLAVSVLLVGGTAHSVNIIDGCNGLAGLFALLTLLVIAYVAHQVGDGPITVIALGGATATFGFLAWNFPRGRIFLGDSGAYLLGTLVAFLLVKLVRDHAAVSPLFAAVLLAYPTWETLFAIYRKRARGVSPMEPDRVHLHMLVHKRLARSCRSGTSVEERVLRNSAATLYLAPLLFGSALAGAAWWGDALPLSASVAMIVSSYALMYAGLARRRVPAALRLSPAPWTWAAKQDSSFAAVRSMENR